MNSTRRGVCLFVVVLTAAATLITARATEYQQNLDDRVKKFLDARQDQWRDLNVPVVDGQTLHDIIVKNKYTRALEIGTSTGHSGIWIAWALSKTGGKLITIEIDEGRHRQALANFEAAGLSKFIDARLGDAHAIVPALAGPFDFVFSDADKTGTRTISTPFCPSSRSVAVMPRTMCAAVGERLDPATTSGTCKVFPTSRPRSTIAVRGWLSVTSAPELSRGGSPHEDLGFRFGS